MACTGGLRTLRERRREKVAPQLPSVLVHPPLVGVPDEVVVPVSPLGHSGCFLPAHLGGVTAIRGPGGCRVVCEKGRGGAANEGFHTRIPPHRHSTKLKTTYIRTPSDEDDVSKLGFVHSGESAKTGRLRLYIYIYGIYFWKPPFSLIVPLLFLNKNPARKPIAGGVLSDCLIIDYRIR